MRSAVRSFSSAELADDDRLAQRFRDELGQLDSESSLVLVFGSPSAMELPGVIEALRAALPRSNLLGCSTAGEILDTEVHDDTLVVTVARFEHSRVATAWSPVERSTDSFEAGRSIAEHLAAPDLTAVVVCSDGTIVNGSELVRGMAASLPPDVVVTGGLAADGDRFRRTFVLADGALSSRCVAAVGLYGSRLRIGHGSKGGWDYFGPERVVTRSVGNVLYEIDGRPALELYKRYLGELVESLPGSALLYPLSIHLEDGEAPLVRTILSVDEASQSLVFAGDVPQGCKVQLMRASLDRLVDGAADAAQQASDLQVDTSAELVLGISCVGRRLLLGERTDEELEAVRDAFSDHTRLVGFYSYGEISPHASGRCELHNQTMTLTSFAEV